MQLFHCCNSTTHRATEPGRAYLIKTTTHQRQPFFSEWCIGRICVRELQALDRFGIVTSLAWVLMPDHLHWLTVLHHTPIDYVMKRVKARSALMINRELGRKGPLWQSGYQDRAVSYEDDLAAIGRYIVNTPMRAGLVTSIGDYPLWDASW